MYAVLLRISISNDLCDVFRTHHLCLGDERSEVIRLRLHRCKYIVGKVIRQFSGRITPTVDLDVDRPHVFHGERVDIIAPVFGNVQSSTDIIVVRAILGGVRWS